MTVQNGVSTTPKASRQSLWEQLESGEGWLIAAHTEAIYWNAPCARLNCGRARALHTGPNKSLEATDQEKHSCPEFM